MGHDVIFQLDPINHTLCKINMMDILEKVVEVLYIFCCEYNKIYLLEHECISVLYISKDRIAYLYLGEAYL